MPRGVAVLRGRPAGLQVVHQLPARQVHPFGQGLRRAADAGAEQVQRVGDQRESMRRTAVSGERLREVQQSGRLRLDEAGAEDQVGAEADGRACLRLELRAGRHLRAVEHQAEQHAVREEVLRAQRLQKLSEGYRGRRWLERM